jgi:Flp pilus assembly protein TadG
VRNLLKSIHLNQDGTTAVEFAIVAPVFFLMLFGTIGLCFALFLIGSLHYAVEDGARCASVKTTICTDANSIVTYAQSRYMGPSSVTPSFSYAAAACGNSVSATISYSMNIGFKTFVIPILATACFPS